MNALKGPRAGKALRRRPLLNDGTGGGVGPPADATHRVPRQGRFPAASPPTPKELIFTVWLGFVDGGRGGEGSASGKGERCDDGVVATARRAARASGEGVVVGEGQLSKRWGTAGLSRVGKDVR
jgi:hypothetical protein